MELEALNKEQQQEIINKYMPIFSEYKGIVRYYEKFELLEITDVHTSSMSEGRKCLHEVNISYYGRLGGVGYECGTGGDILSEEKVHEYMQQYGFEKIKKDIPLEEKYGQLTLDDFL